jgi:acetylornithine deacetylase/succinyl-diaminopimelate desuccinylase-like protein
MMLDTAVSHIRAPHQQYLDQLCDFLRIPSISTLPEYKPDIRRAADWLLADLSRIGLQNAQLLETAGHPVVYAEWLGAGPDKPTVLLYGHYDVQPPGDLSLWDSPPFEPAFRDGKVFARGTSDNKAQLFSHLKALESMLAGNRALPVNVKVCLDGEEELGSPHMPQFVIAQKALLQADSVVVSDGPMIDSQHPAIDYALRGVVAANIRVTGPHRDLHSGSFGGSVHNPAQAIAEILAALHHPDGSVAIPGFYDEVIPLTDEERRLLADMPYDHPQWQAETGAPKLWGEAAYTFLERMTARPTCEVNGVWGGFTGEGFRTIIPAAAGAKVSMRLVAAQDARKIGQQFIDFIHHMAPDTVQVEVTILSGSNAAVTPYDSPGIQAAIKAYEVAWGATPVLSRGGGSLPIIATFQQILGTPFVLMPFGLDDNRHSPNEHYLLQHFYKGMETAVHFYHYLAEE